MLSAAEHQPSLGTRGQADWDEVWAHPQRWPGPTAQRCARLRTLTSGIADLLSRPDVPPQCTTDGLRFARIARSDSGILPPASSDAAWPLARSVIPTCRGFDLDDAAIRGFGVVAGCVDEHDAVRGLPSVGPNERDRPVGGTHLGEGASEGDSARGK